MPSRKKERDLTRFANVKVGDVVYNDPSSGSRIRYTVDVVSPKQFGSSVFRWWKDGTAANNSTSRSV